jgi:hypothetical protein
MPTDKYVVCVTYDCLRPENDKWHFAEDPYYVYLGGTHRDTNFDGGHSNDGFIQWRDTKLTKPGTELIIIVMMLSTESTAQKDADMKYVDTHHYDKALGRIVCDCKELVAK